MRKVSVFVLGCQKCGTTTLAGILGAHPDIFVPSIKETYYFCEDTQYSRGEAYYHGEYYGSSSARKASVWVDATPFYLISKAAIDRIAKYATPESRFIVILRDPLKRAYSAYLHQRRLGNETESFADALTLEPDRIQADQGGRWWRHAYMMASEYDAQLSYAIARLGRARILVLDQSALNDTSALTAQLETHLGLTQRFGPLRQRQTNPASVPRSRYVRNLIIKDGFAKRIVQSIIPRELRSRIGTAMLRRNSRPIEVPPMEENARAMLAARLGSQSEAMQKLGVDAAAQWTGGHG